MQVISRKMLTAFARRCPAAQGRVFAWYSEVRDPAVVWQLPQDIKAMYPQADMIGDQRIVFDIGGNKYRLVAVVLYRTHKVLIKFVGTHAEYDRINAATGGTMSNLTQHPIRTDADHERVMARIHGLAVNDPAPGTTAGDELEVLSLLVRAYEDEHYPVEAVTLEQAIEFRAEQRGLTPKQLDGLFGGSSKRSEVLAGKRELSKSMAARLKEIGVPDSILITLLTAAIPRTAVGAR